MDSNTGEGLRMRAFIRWYYEDYDDGPPPQSGIWLSPNPTSGSMVLHYAGYRPDEQLDVAIYNMLGQLVHAEQFVPENERTEIGLNSGVAPGIYGICVYGNKALLYKGTFLKL